MLYYLRAFFQRYVRLANRTHPKMYAKEPEVALEKVKLDCLLYKSTIVPNLKNELKDANTDGYRKRHFSPKS